MSSVKKNIMTSIQLEMDARKKIFIGRDNELNFFRQNILDPEFPAYKIISISGLPGVGKSTLVAQFMNATNYPYFKDYCLTALVDERQTTTASIMEKFAEQLQIKGEFKRTLARYKQALQKLQDERKALQDTLLHRAPDIIGATVEGIPAVGPVLREGLKVTTERLLVKHYNHQVYKDAERLKDPICELTKAFVTELNRLADTKVTTSSTWKKRERRIVLFFDTFEQLATEVVPWLLDYFLVTDISKNVVLVIAGRYPIEHSMPGGSKRWLPYYDNHLILSISLNSFTEGETRAYLDRRGITDPERIDTIWQLSHGLPLYLGLLTSNPEGEIDPTKDVVDNFLCWIPEKEYIKRRLAQDAALFSRPFNQDDLAAFHYVNENDRPGLYRWLIDQPFVQINLRDGRYKYHKLAQDLFSRHLFISSKKDYYATRRALANHYQQLLTEIEGEAREEIYNPAEVLELTLALAYQLFLLPNEAYHIKAIKQFLNAYDHAEQTREVTRVLHEVYREQLMTAVSEGVRHSVEKLVEYMESDQTSPTFLTAISYLINKVGLEPLFSINMLANMYHQRGYTFGLLEEYQRNVQKYSQTNVLNALPELYRERADAYFAIEEYRRAIVDYSRALKLEPRYILAYIHRGIAYRNLKEYEPAFTDFEHALRLDSKNEAAYAERGRTHRALKNYECAIADFTYALELFPEDVRAYADRGMTYLLLRDIEQAKADLVKSWELNPKDINVSWIVLWIDMCQRGIDAGMVELLEGIASLDQRHYIAYVCKGVVSWIEGHFEEALVTLDQTIASVPEAWDAYFWQGMIYASIGKDEKAIKSFEQAVIMGLPPLLLAPLRWLEQKRPDFYKNYAAPLLSL